MEQEAIVNIPPESVKEADGSWMNILDASSATGLSPATLRRYIKRKKIQSRRLGRTSNAKLQVWITPELLDEQKQERISTDGLEEVLTTDSGDEDDFELDDDQADYSSRETLRWLRDRLEDREERLEESLREKDDEIASLRSQLQAACYRNGYLEAKQESYEEKIRLLTDQFHGQEEPETVEDDSEVSREELEAQLAAVKSQIETMARPWWKRWFLPRDIESVQ